MPIRIARTTQPLNQRPFQPGGSVVPVPAIGNPAAAAVRPAQQAAGLAAQIFQEQRDREIVTRVSELDIQRRKSDADVVDGYRSLQGKDAVEQRAAAMAAISANARTVKEGIQDREVAGIWARQDAELTLAAQQQLDTHYRQQNTRWQADTQDARASLLVNDLGRAALGDGYNPATGQLSVEAERSRSAYHDAIGEMGSILGWGKEQVEVARRKADTQAYGQVADSLNRQDRFGEAQKVLDRYGDRIDVGTRDKLAQQAREGAAQQSERARISQVQDRAARVADHLDAQPISLREKLAATKAWFNEGKLTIEERDAAETRIKQAGKLRQDEQDREEKDALDAAQVEAQTKRVGFAGLDPGTQQRLRTSGAEARFRLFELQGNQFITTTVGATALFASDEQISQIRNRDDIVKKFGGEMAPKDLEQLLKRWDAVKTGKQAPDGWIHDEVRLAAIDAGILPTAVDGRPEMSEADKNRLLRVLNAVRRTASRGDKVATKADVEAAIKKEMGNVIRDASGKLVPAASLSATEMTAAWDTFAQDWGDSQVALSAATDPMRIEAVKRIEIRNQVYRELGLPTAMDPEHLPTLTRELGAMRSEQKSQAIEEARAMDRQRVAEWQATRDLLYENGWGGLERRSETAAAAAAQKAADRKLAERSKTGANHPGPDSPGLKAYKEAEAKKLRDAKR